MKRMRRRVARSSTAAAAAISAALLVGSLTPLPFMMPKPPAAHAEVTSLAATICAATPSESVLVAADMRSPRRHFMAPARLESSAESSGSGTMPAAAAPSGGIGCQPAQGCTSVSPEVASMLAGYSARASRTRGQPLVA